MSLAGVAGATGWPRPTARRILLTLEQMGYVRAVEAGSSSPRALLELGMSYVLSRNLWEWPGRTWSAWWPAPRVVIHRAAGRSDIVYVARVAVPKIVALAVTIGTRFPAMQTSLGRCCCRTAGGGGAACAGRAQRVGIPPRIAFSNEERVASLREVRARGWALTDETGRGIRSGPRRSGGEGRVIASLNVNTHAAETPSRC